VSITGAWEGKLNKRRKEVKVQNREETTDESDKSPSEKDVRVFNEHSSLIEPYHFYLSSLYPQIQSCAEAWEPWAITYTNLKVVTSIVNLLDGYFLTHFTHMLFFFT